MGIGALPVLALHVRPELQSTSRAAAVAACGIAYLPVPLALMCAGMLVGDPSRGRRVLWAGALGGVLTAGYRRWRATGPGEVPAAADRDLTVVSANVLYGRGDVGDLRRLARRADIIAIQENTPTFDAALGELIGADFPHRLGTSDDNAEGTMMWSRTPLTLVATGDTRYTSVVARTTVRGVAWTIANAHPAPPPQGSRAWDQDAARLLDLVRPYADEHLVVVGDFNATEEHVTMRRFLAAGLRNAMAGWPRAATDGWQPSWPSGVRWLPPLIRIDHALHSASVDAWRPSYVVLAGSDHKALVADFRAR